MPQASSPIDAHALPPTPNRLDAWFDAYTPKALAQAAAAQTPDSWQAAGYRSAAQASGALHSPAMWLAQGALVGAKAAGMATGPAGTLVAGYTVARLACGDGEARGTTHKAPSVWQTQQSFGFLGLGERFCRHAAQSAALAVIPGARSVAAGIATGLNGLGQGMRAVLGLVSAVAAVGGAALGIVVHVLGRAIAALRRAPERMRQLVTQLQTQMAYWEQLFSSGVALVARAGRVRQRANNTCQAVLTPIEAYIAHSKQLLRRVSPLLNRPAASAAVHRPASQLYTQPSLWLALSVRGCLDGVATGAQRVSQGAGAIKHTLARVQNAMALVAHAAVQWAT